MNQTFDHGLSTPQLQTLKTILKQCPSVVEKVSVFGSRATATCKSYSDIDLVLYGSISEGDIDRLWTLFNESNLPYKVDINAYHLIHYPPLKRHIDQFSKVLFTQDELDNADDNPKTRT